MNRKPKAGDVWKFNFQNCINLSYIISVYKSEIKNETNITLISNFGDCKTLSLKDFETCYTYVGHSKTNFQSLFQIIKNYGDIDA